MSRCIAASLSLMHVSPKIKHPSTIAGSSACHRSRLLNSANRLPRCLSLPLQSSTPCAAIRLLSLPSFFSVSTSLSFLANRILALFLSHTPAFASRPFRNCEPIYFGDSENCKTPLAQPLFAWHLRQKSEAASAMLHRTTKHSTASATRCRIASIVCDNVFAIDKL